MEMDLPSQLRGYEGTAVWLTLADGEVLLAKVPDVWDDPGEEQHVVVDIVSTDQPELYARMRGSYLESAWAIPLGMIVSVTSQRKGPSGNLRA